MENYYRQQNSQPHFSSYARQKGAGIGALAVGIGRVALPFARKILLPAVKRIGRDFLSEANPEAIEVATKRKSVKQATKSAIKKTAKRQIGGGAKRKTTKKRVISRKRKPQLSRASFFSRVRNAK